MHTLYQLQNKHKEYQYTTPKKRHRSTHSSTTNKLLTKHTIGTTIFISKPLSDAIYNQFAEQIKKKEHNCF